MRRHFHDSIRVTRNIHDRPNLTEALAEFESFKAILREKVDARIQKDAFRLSESIRRVIWEMALTGSTGILARNLLAKHATSTTVAAQLTLLPKSAAAKPDAGSDEMLGKVQNALHAS